MFYLQHWYLDVIAMITSFMTSFTCAFFYSKIFTPKKKSKFYFLKYLLILYGTYLICRFIPKLYEFRALIIMSSYFISLCILSKDKLGKKIFITLLTQVFMILVDIPMSMVTFSKYGYSFNEVNSMMDEEYFALYDLIYSNPNSLALNSLNNIILCFFFINLMMIYKKETRHFNIWLVYTIITILFVSDSILTYYYLDNNASVILLLSSSLVVLILLFYFINKLKIYTKYDEYKNENKFLKEKEQMQYEYYEMVSKREENVRKISHDIKNNLQVMLTLKDENERLTIANDINDSLNKYSLVKYSTQDILNVILNIKVKESKENNINLNIDVKTNLSFMESIDVSNLITNILDNAITAATNTTEKEINFSIRKKMNFIIIECSNTYTGEIKFNKKNELITSKKGNHGYGSKIIKSIIEKYNGQINYKVNDDKFTISIMIKK